MTGRLDLPRVFRGPLVGSWPEMVLRCIPALVYLGLIHLVSSVPGEELPAVIDDRIAHFVQYFGLGVLLHLAASGFDAKGRPWLVVVAVVSFASAWGAIDEYHQSFVPGRDSSLKDLGFDIAGAATATLVVRWLAWRRVTE
jgi:VanZ family protein